MSTNEIAELLLAALYEEAETLGHSNFFLSVDEISVNVGLEDRAAVVEASRMLEDKGYILLTFDHTGAMSAFITPSGEDFAVNGGETGIIDEYRRYRSLTGNRAADISVSDVQAQAPAAALPQTERPVPNSNIAHIIASMEMLILNDPSLQESAREDMVADIRTLELQMSKKVMNEPLLDLIIAGLKKTPAISPLLDLLISMNKSPG